MYLDMGQEGVSNTNYCAKSPSMDVKIGIVRLEENSALINAKKEPRKSAALKQIAYNIIIRCICQSAGYINKQTKKMF